MVSMCVKDACGASGCHLVCVIEKTLILDLCGPSAALDAVDQVIECKTFDDEISVSTLGRNYRQVLKPRQDGGLEWCR